MSKKTKQSSKVRRREEKKKRKLSNYLRFGPKNKGGSKALRKLKGERKPKGRRVHTAGHARRGSRLRAEGA